MRLSWYHLHSLMSYNINLVVGSPPTGPITGATGRGLLSHQAISSRSFGFFFTVGSRMGFPPTAHSLDAIATVTRPFKAFALCGCYCTGLYITYRYTGCQGFSPDFPDIPS